jgi:ABC-2 type transport system permease protein
MSSGTPISAADPRAKLARPAPPLGGFNATVLRIEVRRLLRNRRTIIFSVVTPVLFYLLFGFGQSYATDRVGRGNVSAFIMISMALYGAVLATTSGGARVAVERVLGWSRTLRVTPLSPSAYVAVKIATAMVLGLVSVVVVYAVGLGSHKPSMPAGIWVATGATVWVGSVLFAAFGLFLGYLLPSENVAQVNGFIIMLFSFGGGLFIPLSEFSSTIRGIAKWTPLYGLNQLVHAPLLGGGVDWTWVANLLAWLVIFTAGALWRFRRDTARV